MLGLNYMAKNVTGSQEAVKLSQRQDQAEVNKLVNFVNDAASLVSSKGAVAFTEFRKANSKWWQGDSYIFVYDLNSKTLVLPPTPEVEGTSRYNTKDSKGKFYVREMAEYLKNHDAGWIDYSYPKPGETASSLKLGYFKKAMMDGKPVLVGSGIYLN